MINLVIDQRRRSLGAIEVGRVLPHAQRRMVGPFVFFDHIGPLDMTPGFAREADVRPHPHIGLSTLTYLFDGEITHRDSVDAFAPIKPGEVNWMTAGRGVTHSERFETLRQHGGRLHGIQAWIALPRDKEEVAPTFDHYPAAALPTYEGGGLSARLIAGAGFGTKAPVAVHSPLFYAHWTLEAGAKAQLPADYEERAAYVVEGEVEVDGQRLGAGKMIIFAPGQPVLFTATQRSIVMLLGGEPVGERFIDWNFVSSSKERIEQARDDWRAGRFKLPDADHDEFIPLP
jgi:redox-sensitive bicupin YhaK (pirin superfamily)